MGIGLLDLTSVAAAGSLSNGRTAVLSGSPRRVRPPTRYPDPANTATRPLSVPPSAASVAAEQSTQSTQRRYEMRKLKNTLTYANVVATLGVFLAISGSALAVSAVTKNSVTSRSIKAGAVKGSDVKDDTLKGSDVNEASLDFGGLTELVGPRGELGATGPVGPSFATAFSNPKDPVPTATPDTAVLNGQYSHTFVTPASGRLLVYASLNVLGVTCSVGSGNAFLYLDGIGVPGSGQRQPGAADADPFTPIASTDVVPAGEHTLTIALDCPMGNPTADASSGDGDLGAVLIGG
jgi:hypothetical protein